MKRVIKNNLKLVIGFILGGIMCSGITYAATVSFNSGDVSHTKASGSQATMSFLIPGGNGNNYILAKLTNVAAGDKIKTGYLSIDGVSRSFVTVLGWE